ncbi:recombinase family protein [Mesorhizobium sp.]|uniref:recombinase family protein n=1 Tax=Mesorhizobium sp. TaxID=1871066 RepID=UPI000FE91F57|nr:MAG: recombinase family protein [Mesorhizobium sp.]
MTKITADHLARSAYVYIRQSTPDQLANNPERRRRQYALKTRARVLGWENVVVIDDDLGRSGGGTARPGFERLRAASAERHLIQQRCIASLPLLAEGALQQIFQIKFTETLRLQIAKNDTFTA